MRLLSNKHSKSCFIGFALIVQQHISGTVPVQRLDPIRPAATEQKDGCLIQFLPELQLDHGHQSVDLLAHIRIPAGDEVVLHPTEIKHGDSALSPIRRLPPRCSRQAT